MCGSRLVLSRYVTFSLVSESSESRNMIHKIMTVGPGVMPLTVGVNIVVHNALVSVKNSE